jgi:hypothetical protein
MCWRSGIVLLMLAGNALAVDGYIVGAGLEGDSAEGLSAMLAAEYEYRDFRFELPETDFFPGRTIRFDANGIGLST